MRVMRDHTNHIAIEVYRTPKFVGAVVTERAQRLFKKIPPKAFDARWKVSDHDLMYVATKWVRQTALIALNTKARRTLEMIIAILNNKVIAKADDAETLSAIVPTGTELVDLSTLSEMSGTELARIHNAVTGGNLERARNKTQVVDLIKQEVFKMSTETEATNDKAAEKQRKADEKLEAKNKKAAEKLEAKNKKAAEKAEAKAKADAEKLASGAAPRATGSVAKVHAICHANPGMARKDVVALCVADGVNEGTAKTQFQAWHKKNATVAA